MDPEGYWVGVAVYVSVVAGLGSAFLSSWFGWATGGLFTAVLLAVALVPAGRRLAAMETARGRA